MMGKALQAVVVGIWNRGAVGWGGSSIQGSTLSEGDRFKCEFIMA